MSEVSPDRNRPVFLHGMWRSGSTYVWSRFRTAEGTYCFYEPLHQGLHRLTCERIERDTPEIVAGNSHPALSRPYFEEFRPLLKQRGVRHFQRRLAFGRFILEPGEKDEALHRYISSLVEHAQSVGRQAVLGFNRTGLRMGWLKGNFSSYNVHIDRDPLQVWHSYEQQKAKRNYTFYESWLSVVEQNAANPLFAPLAKRLPLRRGAQKFLTKPKRFYHEAIDGMRPADTYFMTFYLWAACALHALSHCDAVLDMDRMEEPGYTYNRASLIKKDTGVDIAFDDARAVIADPPIAEHARLKMEQEALSVLPRQRLNAATVRRRLAELAPRKGDLLGRAV